MKIETRTRRGPDALSKLDWHASEVLREAERAQTCVAGEVSQLNSTASEILREARRARAEAVRRCFQSMLRDLWSLVSGSLTAPRHTGVREGDTGRKRRWRSRP